MDEQWKTVDGTDYAVSNLGRVMNTRRGTFLRPSLSSRGYPCVYMGKTRSVHPLVATAFLGPRPTLTHQVNHKDGDKTNNRADNLEWVTPRQNVRHAYDVLGRVGKCTKPLRGESNGFSKLTAAKVAEIRARLSGGEMAVAVAKSFGVSPSNISCIVRGLTWAGVGVRSETG